MYICYINHLIYRTMPNGIPETPTVPDEGEGTKTDPNEDNG